MTDPLPYIIVGIFVVAQILFALMIYRLYQLTMLIWELFVSHDAYTTGQDVNKAKLGSELHKKLDLILRRIAQTKTRLADEERQDQAAKRKARRGI